MRQDITVSTGWTDSIRLEPGGTECWELCLEPDELLIVKFVAAIAYLSELIHPSAIFLGLTRLNLMRQSIRYFLLGEGESGLMVYRILERYWERTKEEGRPCIFLMAD